MPRFIARPVVVEAHKWEGSSGFLPDEFRRALLTLPDGSARVNGGNGPTSLAQRGDWLVRGGDGLIVVVKAAAFEVAFEELPPERPVTRVSLESNDGAAGYTERPKRAYNRKEHANV